MSEAYNKQAGDGELTAINSLPSKSDKRFLAVRRFLKENPGLVQRAAQRAEVHDSMVSKVLHGVATSAKVMDAVQWCLDNPELAEISQEAGS